MIAALQRLHYKPTERNFIMQWKTAYMHHATFQHSLMYYGEWLPIELDVLLRLLTLMMSASQWSWSM